MDAIQVGVACPCPGTPHPDGDTIGLRPKLGLRAGVKVQHVIQDAKRAADEGGKLDMADITGILMEAYLLEGVAEWTLVDADGAPIPVNPDTIRAHLLDDFTLAGPIAEEADSLYYGPVVSPLVIQASTSSPPSPTNGSTSASNGHTPKPRKRSRPSSTSTSQTGATVTTTASPAGDSS